MKLALNTLVYEVGNKGPEISLRSAIKFGFKFIDYAGIRKGNPMTMSSSEKRNIRKIFSSEGLVSSQMLLISTRDTAHHDPSKRNAVFDYMKCCAEFQKELGGRQLLVCWGGAYMNWA